MVAGSKSDGGKRRRQGTRPTQAERTAATRDKLVKSAIATLAKFGYAATSTTVVADHAGISRGSIFYNFPTKVDLMLEVLTYVFEEDIRYYVRALDGVPAGRERTLKLMDLGWDVLSAEGGVAVMHIMLGAAGDPQLQARLPEAMAKISQMSTLEYQSTEKQSPRVAHLMKIVGNVHVAALRGLAMSLATGAPRSSVAEELALLRRYLVFALDTLVPETENAKDRGKPRRKR